MLFKIYLRGIGTVLLFLILPLGFKEIYFRDYAIIFDGAYRMGVLGHQPYHDFGIPVGPVAFWLPALMFNLFGPSWSLLTLVQFMIQFSGLIALWLILRRLRVDYEVAWVVLMTHILWFVWPNQMPWYNTTAYICELWSILFTLLVLERDEKFTRIDSYLTFSLAGLSTALAILSKQDFGLLAMLLNLFLISNQSVKGYTIGNLVVYFISVLAASLTLSFGIYGWEFAQWFNFGLPPHESRLTIGRLAHVAIQPDWRYIILGIGFAWYLINRKQLAEHLKRNHIISILSVGMVFQSFLTSATSGIPVSHLYYIPWVLLLFIKIGSHNGLTEQFKLVVIGTSLINLLIVPDFFTSLGGPRLVLSWGQGWSEGNPLEGNDQRIYKLSYIDGMRKYWPEETINQFDDMVSATQLGIAKNPDARFKLLNFSEFTFIYGLLGVEPPKGLPLWFDEKATFFEPKRTELIKRITAHEFAVIWWQEPHSKLPDTIKTVIDLNYDKVLVVSAPAEGRPVTLYRSKTLGQDFF